LKGYWGHETGDPAKVAQVTLQLATSDAGQFARLAEDNRESDAKAWLDVSVSSDAERVQEQPALKL
jgi:hypothetical protein